MNINAKWLPLFGMNFLSVLNDNYLKVLAFFIAAQWIVEDYKSVVIALASALFVLPYILCSPLAGKLARQHSKVKIIRRAKLFEIPIMMIASISFIFSSIELCLFSIFLMGLQSALFSPAKYGIIKDVGGKAGVSFGTGAMEMFTFLGILLGTYLAGLSADLSKYASVGSNDVYIISIILVSLAVLGYLSSLRIRVSESVPEQQEESLNPIAFVRTSYQWSKQIKGLNTVVISLATFWAIGSLLQMNITLYCEQELGLDAGKTAYVMALAAIGMAVGCYVTGWVSGKHLKMTLVPLGGLGMLLCSSTIVIFAPPVPFFAALIFFAAFFAGVFKIPLNAFMQRRVEGRKLGVILAYNNLVVFSFIFVSSGIFALVETHSNPRIVFVVISLICLFVTLLSYFRVPEAGKKS